MPIRRPLHRPHFTPPFSHLRLPSATIFFLLFLTFVPFRHCPFSVECHFIGHFFCHFISTVCLNLCSPPTQLFTVSFVSGAKIYELDNNANLQFRQHLSQNAQKLPLLFYPPYAFIHRMSADVSVAKVTVKNNCEEKKKSRERKRISAEKEKNYSNKWDSISREGQKKKQISRRMAAQSEEKRRKKKGKPFTEMPMDFTHSPQIKSATLSSWTRTTIPKRDFYWTSTAKTPVEDRRHRSASESIEKSTERHKKLTNRPSSTDSHRLAISSKMRKGAKNSAKSQQQQKLGRGSGKAASNWHTELRYKTKRTAIIRSTEQSISMMLRCQEIDTRELLPSATTCRNLRSDKVCNYLFQEIDTKMRRRDVKCNLQGLEDIAESCRKTCGICCEDINYACEDDQNGIVDCSRQLDKCHQKKWFAVLSRFCAGSCGLCAMSTCRDYGNEPHAYCNNSKPTDNSCRVRKSLCLKQESLDYMRENCARTCGFCVIGENSALIGGKEEKEKGNNEKKGGTANAKENSGKPVVVGRPPKSKHRLVLPECTDKMDNCTANAHLCNSPSLGEYMIKFCTKTCLKCGEAQTSKTNGDGKSVHGPPSIELIIEPMMETNNENGKGRNSNRDTKSSTRGRRTRKCVDLEVRCIQWKGKGLCGEAKNVTTKFSEGQRKGCAKTCGDC